MAQFEQSTVPADSTAAAHATPEHNIAPAEPTGRMPLIALLIALAFGASAFFFYHQGQRDAAQSAAASQASIMDDAAGGSTSPTSDNGDRASTTATQAADDGKPDIIVTVHPTAAQMRAPVAKRMLAKTAKPANAPRIAPPIDRQVALTSHPQPVYPVQALRAREQGTVLVLAQVDVNGHVSDARIVQGSGSRILDRAAPKEVQRWRFEPAMHNGQPIVASVEVPISYRLGQ